MCIFSCVCFVLHLFWCNARKCMCIHGHCYEGLVPHVFLHSFYLRMPHLDILNLDLGRSYLGKCVPMCMMVMTKCVAKN